MMPRNTSSANESRLAIGLTSAEKVFTAYNEVLCELGELAPYIAKSKIYEMVSKKVGLSAERAKRLILTQNSNRQSKSCK